MRMNKIVAIDPGVGGAIAVLDKDWYKTYPMLVETNEILKILFKTWVTNEYTFVMEKVPYTAGFNRPAARIAKLFESASFAKGFLMALNAKIVMVRPNEWQKSFKPLDKAYAKRKTQLWKKVQELYPTVKITKKAADAYGILYWYLNEGNEE